MIHLNNYFNYDPSDCLTPEEEAEIDARYLERARARMAGLVPLKPQRPEVTGGRTYR